MSPAFLPLFSIRVSFRISFVFFVHSMTIKLRHKKIITALWTGLDWFLLTGEGGQSRTSTLASFIHFCPKQLGCM